MTVANKSSADDLRLPPLSEFLAGTLKTLYLSFTQSPEGIPRSKEELIDALAPHIDDERVSQLIARLEATQPFRHVYIYALSGACDERKIRQALEAMETTSPMCVNDKSGLYYLDSCPHEYPLIRLAHRVQNTHYVPDGVGRLKIQHSSFRHAVVIAIKPTMGIVEFRFSGYEQNKLTPENHRISYPDIATLCREFLKIYFGLEVRGLALKAPVEQLLKTYSDEVAQSKNVSRVGKGRILLDVGDADDAGDLTELITQAFRFKGTDDRPSKAMSSWTAENVTLNWLRFKTATRINYVGDTPEIMFSWKAAEHRSQVNADLIIKRMVEFADLDYSRGRRRVADTVDTLSSEDVVTVLDVSQRAGVATTDALDYLLHDVGTRKMRMVFRVRTAEHLLDASNGWVDSVGALPREVHTVKGEQIVTSDPRNVEVGFLPVGMLQ